MFGADHPYLFLAYVVCVIAIIVWAFLPLKRPKFRTFEHAPISTFINGYCRHDIYQDVSLDAVTTHWGETAFDFIYGDIDARNPVIVVVLVHNWVAPIEFCTRFQIDGDRMIDVTWRPTKRKVYGEAWGLFVFSHPVHSATTQVQKPA